MKTRIFAGAVLLLAFVVPTNTTATLLLDDGGAHTINGLVEDTINVRAGSTLNVETGAIIAPPTVAESGGLAIFSESEFGSDVGYEVLYPANTINISGGLIEGGIGNAYGGLARDTDLTISGGLITGGITFGGGAGSRGTVTITGGEILGPVQLEMTTRDGSPSVDISGGVFGDVILLHFGTQATISGGIFSNPDGDVIHVRNGSILNITGGLFDGETFWVRADSVMNVFGTDLDFTDGHLTGFLADGNQISLVAGPLFNGGLHLIDVPEPSTFMLLGIGLAALGWVGQRRKKDR
jgi:ketosteroid isomerase-like protein